MNQDLRSLLFSPAAVFDAAIKINPQDAVAYRNRGQALKKIGKAAEGEADLAKAAQMGGEVLLLICEG